MRRRRASWVAAFAVAVATCGVPAATAEDAPGWYPVREKWQPFPEGNLNLPAEDYCGSFDLRLTGVQQAVRVKVLTRWDDGTPRTEKYAGTLRSRATNASTGTSTVLNLSGTASVLYRPDGTMQTYETHGPVGMGWPAGSGGELDQGYYRLTGRHVVTFDADGTRRLTTASGRQSNVCDLVS